MSRCKIGLKRSAHDRIDWDFEQMLVDSTAARLRFVAGREPKPIELQNIARSAIAVAIVIFGFDSVNTYSKDHSKAFAVKIASLLCRDGFEHFPRVCREGLGGLDRLSTLVALLGKSHSSSDLDAIARRNYRTVTAALRDLQKVVSSDSNARPNLGSLPYFEIGKLVVSSRYECEAFQDIRERVQSYKHSDGGAPLNIGVFGPAGSGKSFGVKELFNEVYGDARMFHEFNLSGINNPDTLGDLFLRLQDTAMRGLHPIAFWDEFDTFQSKELGWLHHFLGPMQDGTFVHNGYERKLPPKVTFVFAGSMFRSFGEMMLLDCKRTGMYKELLESEGDGCIGWDEEDPEFFGLFDKATRFSAKDFADAKGPDFKSRLDAVLDIRGLAALVGDEFTCKGVSVSFDLGAQDTDTSRLYRRARILEYHLRTRYKELRPEKHLLIRPSTLRSLLFEEHYQHDARSIERTVKMLGLQTRDVIDDTVVPTGSQRRIHMSIGAFEE